MVLQPHALQPEARHPNDKVERAAASHTTTSKSSSTGSKKRTISNADKHAALSKKARAREAEVKTASKSAAKIPGKASKINSLQHRWVGGL
ncbi:hypothetical protein FA13DRAFT_1803078 [Coprinellus micaceus]|uniref:Uncharacterized protein n=1 Tax=Coprinellus micaceus TaxID=71717 RepID=A0A4Y7SAY5_COPMI|nr:hypothetical protein FA13DRAFT_1803078 [Coprinellus micaceus]